MDLVLTQLKCMVHIGTAAVLVCMLREVTVYYIGLRGKQGIHGYLGAVAVHSRDGSLALCCVERESMDHVVDY